MKFILFSYLLYYKTILYRKVHFALKTNDVILHTEYIVNLITEFFEFQSD